MPVVTMRNQTQKQVAVSVVMTQASAMARWRSQERGRAPMSSSKTSMRLWKPFEVSHRKPSTLSGAIEDASAAAMSRSSLRMSPPVTPGSRR